MKKKKRHNALVPACKRPACIDTQRPRNVRVLGWGCGTCPVPVPCLQAVQARCGVSMRLGAGFRIGPRACSTHIHRGACDGSIAGKPPRCRRRTGRAACAALRSAAQHGMAWYGMVRDSSLVMGCMAVIDMIRWACACFGRGAHHHHSYDQREEPLLRTFHAWRQWSAGCLPGCMHVCQ